MQGFGAEPGLKSLVLGQALCQARHINITHSTLHLGMCSGGRAQRGPGVWTCFVPSLFVDPCPIPDDTNRHHLLSSTVVG